MITTARGDAALSSTQVFRWYKAFKDDRESIEGDHCSEPPSTSKTNESVAKMRSMLRRNRRLTLRKIAHEASVRKDTVHRVVVKELDMRKI
ncbi:hypothetical protein Trydic_g20592 [Trypoxylus dichotomus]